MGPTRLYLDTARLGRMSPGAARAHAEFGRLATKEAGSAFFQRFLRDGAAEWPVSLRAEYPGLVAWEGAEPLKASLRRLVGARPDLPLLLANRTAQLMKLAAALFFGPCRNVLTTDLGWPPYQRVLAEAAARAGRRVTVVALHDAVFGRKAAAEEVIRAVVDQYRRAGCDGLFLGAVGHLGARLPVADIVRAAGAVREARFVVVDGAQEFCHVPTRLGGGYFDLYLTGCHKWLGGFHPMGIGIYGRKRSCNAIRTAVRARLAAGDLDDPLLRLSGEWEGGTPTGEGETVSLAAVFTALGAAGDASGRGGADDLRLANRATAEVAARNAGWTPLAPDDGLRTGILLLRPDRPAARRHAPDRVRERFAERGVALTAYDGGVVRISMPSTPWENEHLDVLTDALKFCA